MAKLDCPGCGTELDPPEGDEVKHCVVCGGEYIEVELSPAELLDLLVDAEDGPAKDRFSERLAEIGAEQIIAELGG